MINYLSIMSFYDKGTRRFWVGGREGVLGAAVLLLLLFLSLHPSPPLQTSCFLSSSISSFPVSPRWFFLGLMVCGPCSCSTVNLLYCFHFDLFPLFSSRCSWFAFPTFVTSFLQEVLWRCGAGVEAVGFWFDYSELPPVSLLGVIDFGLTAWRRSNGGCRLGGLACGWWLSFIDVAVVGCLC